MTDGPPPLKTIQRAFEILDLLKREKQIGVAELAQTLDLPKSTVHDYLRTLRTMGYVVNESGSYRLSLQILELGGQVKYRNRLFHVAKPELERLVEETGEQASINVEERGEFVILHTEFGADSLRLGIYPGLRTPIHTHAGGKVILAHLPEERIEQIVANHGLTARTEYTITDPDDLVEELATLREQGYGVDRNEQVVGMGAVAAPVQIEDRVVGSIGIVCPSDRLLEEDYRETLAAEVQKSANIVSVNYQYAP
ncbi:IclR family transcriptional regulator [Halobellus clavatus]|jgi:DNA-binding IclR family transcriptional regulator|uniref:Transcriptional regulator, IclR family n=1 Tax=Halobellus clavatus TaxID=660517 RepID=A0A1H3H2Y3_9EURY|nr:IclR family transcriptional regulator [Halobellus clavatus]SDY09124.1 transcriptional regulator, IclR family [Halobellus clavatus]